MFSRDYGAVSYKADVYSLEMMGLKKAANNGSKNVSVYFPDWIYEDFETGKIVRRFGDQITKEEENIAKKLVLVALWCIQNHPSDRPRMSKVIEMLEGGLGDISAPPRPVSRLRALRVAETLAPIDEVKLL